MVEGKIVEIFDDKDLAISCGEAQGAKVDMRFVVYERGREVKDPETRKSLGFIELVKGEIVIVKAFANFSYARAVDMVVGKDYSGGSGLRNSPLDKLVETLVGVSGISGFAGSYYKDITEHTKLDVPAEKVKIELSPSDKTVHIGDLVRQK